MLSVGRMTRKERKQTLTEELLADAELTQSRRKRFGALSAGEAALGAQEGARHQQGAQEGVQAAAALMRHPCCKDYKVGYFCP